MVDITHKTNTLRIATAEATVKVSSQATIDAVVNNTVPKGNVFEMAKTAGFFGVKNCPSAIPDCHPIPVEGTTVDYEINGLEIKIILSAKTIYKTGIEVEAMYGASVVAMTMYDMLKPIDKGIEVCNIRLLDKKGGKSDLKKKFKKGLKASVVLVSDAVVNGKKEDKVGEVVRKKLEEVNVEVVDYRVIPDDKLLIEEFAKREIQDGSDIVLFAGSTGLTNKDTAPEALIPMFEKRVPGIEEAIRAYGQERTPFSMISRSVAGIVGKSLVLAIPGSSNGAKESMDAIFPGVLHIFNIMKIGKND